MNGETTRVLAGEETTNLAPYLHLPPALRRPDAITTPRPRPAMPVPAETPAAPRIVLPRAGRGRHRNTDNAWTVWHYVLAAALLTFAGAIAWAVIM